MAGHDRTEAVDGLAEGVDDSAEHGVAHGDIHDAARGAALVALLDVLDVTEEDGADLISVEVLCQAVDITAGR